MNDVTQILSRIEDGDGKEAEQLKLRFFAGMTLEEASAVLAIGPHTATRDWAAARIWLYRGCRLAEPDPEIFHAYGRQAPGSD